MAEDLNLKQQRTNLASDQIWTQIWDHWIIASSTCWPLSQAGSILNQKLNMVFYEGLSQVIIIFFSEEMFNNIMI